jgi:hypothetical protein
LKEYDELHLQPPQLIRSKVGVIFRQFSTQIVGAQLSTTTNQKDCNPPFFYFISPLTIFRGFTRWYDIIILLFETYKTYRDLNLPSSGGS